VKQLDSHEFIKVLVIDDNVDFLLYMQQALSVPQTSVLALDNPFDAIEAFVENRPQFTFLDVNMPGINGMSLYRMLQAIASYDARLILLSANEVYTRDLSFNEQGIIFLRKPISVRQLRSIVAGTENLQSKVA
jgi:DNA-binding response OmpR family regulator